MLVILSSSLHFVSHLFFLPDVRCLKGKGRLGGEGMVQIRESRAQGTSRSSGLGLFTALLYWETCALLAGPGNLGEFAELLGRLSPGTVTCSGSDVCVPPEVMCMPLCVCARASGNDVRSSVHCRRRRVSFLSHAV